MKENISEENNLNLKMLGFNAPGGRLPVGGVPGQEPASEGGGFMALFHHHHRSLLVPAARISLYVLFGCSGDKEFHKLVVTSCGSKK